MLKEIIIADKKDAMKTGLKQQNLLLGTVIGELDRISKTPSDEQVLKVIKKMQENLIECNEIDDSNFLKKYLPIMLSDEELELEINNFCKDNNITEKKELGKIMNHLKTNFSGLYDGKKASIIASNIF